MLWLLILVALNPAARAFLRSRAEQPRASTCRAARFPLLGPWLASAAVLLSAPGARADREVCLDAHERAQVDRLQGRYLAAREQLLLCAQRDCPRLVSTDCTTWLAELDMTQPTVVFAVSDEAGRDLLEARVIVNGKLIANHTDGHAVPLDPGVYTVRFEADGYVPDEQSLSVRDGEKSRLARATLKSLSSAASTLRSRAEEPRASTSATAPAGGDHGAARGAGDPRARRLRIATYVLGAAALASFSVTLASSLRGHHLYKACDQGCSDSDRERGKLLYRTVNVSAIVGGALLGAAAVTLLSGRRRAASHDAARVGMGAYADVGVAGVTAWGRW
jgi:hypothetical protein